MDTSSLAANGAPVRLNCLGSVELVVDGRATALRAGRKALALLAVLAAEPGHRASRDALAALLWSDRFDEQARQSLRQILSQLRRDIDAVAPEILEIDRDGVALVGCACDVDEFQHAVARGDGVAAARLWRGDFAADIDIDARAWRDWRDAVRARLRPCAMAAFEAAARAAPDAQGRLDAAERMLSADPSNEVAIRIAIPAIVETRGAAAAASRFQSFEADLRGKYGREPHAETLAALAGALRDPVRVGRPGRSFARPAVVACVLIAIAAAGTAGLKISGGGIDGAETPANAVAGPFIDVRRISWPFRFFVGAPRAGDRDPATARIVERLDDDLVAALGVMPGSAVAASAAQADFVMESDVRSGDGGRLAVNLRLVERASGRVLWADTLAGVERYAATGISQRAAPIDTAVARAYAALLVEMDQRRPQTEVPAAPVAEAVREAWSALRGGADREKVDRSDAAFRRAIELDPESADARIGMAHSRAMYLVNGWSERPAEDAATALRLIGETIDRSARQPVAFFVLGLIHKSQRDYARGLAALRVTLQIQPTHAASYAQSAHMHLLSGDAQRGLELAELGVMLGPQANALDRALLYAGMARFLVGDDAGAVRHLEKTFAMNRTFPDVYAWYAAALLRSGREADAADVVRRMRARWPAHRFDHHAIVSHFPDAMVRFTAALAELESDRGLEEPRAANSN